MMENVGDIRGGMDVFSIAGEMVGIVTDVRLSRSDADTPDIGRPVTVPLPPDVLTTEYEGGDDPTPDKGHVWRQEGRGHAAAPAPTPSASIAPTETGPSYFLVEGDTGILSVPVRAVISLFPGENLTLDCTKVECIARYLEKPR